MLFTPAFERAFAFTAEWEGGYSNDPVDPGGETIWGFSRRSYPNLDFDKFTIEQAKQLAFRDYWLKVRGEVLPSPLNIVMYDWGFHSGPVAAILSLQKILGVKIDGKFGPQTKASAISANQQILIQELLEERLESMILQAHAQPEKLKYLSNGKRSGGGGWVGRIVALAMECGASLPREP